jgi:thiol:disulfide interchange protein DsbD
MFATVVWLLWVLGLQVGVNGVAGLLAVLVALAFAVWALALPGVGRTGRAALGAVAVAVLGASVMWAWPTLQPEAPLAASNTPAKPAASRWQPWSPAAVAQARAEGRPVFVDFTAAWCVTCQVNKLTTLSDAAVLADFERRDVQLMRADWTSRDPRITEELARLGRSGVPVYALHAGDAKQPPRLLSEVLTAADIRQALAELPATSSTARPSEPSSTNALRSP